MLQRIKSESSICTAFSLSCWSWKLKCIHMRCHHYGRLEGPLKICGICLEEYRNNRKTLNTWHCWQKCWTELHHAGDLTLLGSCGRDASVRVQAMGWDRVALGEGPGQPLPPWGPHAAQERPWGRAWVTLAHHHSSWLLFSRQKGNSGNMCSSERMENPNVR